MGVNAATGTIVPQVGSGIRRSSQKGVDPMAAAKKKTTKKKAPAKKPAKKKAAKTKK